MFLVKKQRENIGLDRNIDNKTKKIGLSNLFVLKSPLQIINAIEAIEHFQLKNNVFVIIHNRLQNNSEQMKVLLDLGNKVDEIIHVEEKYKSKYFEYVKLIKSLKKRPYDYLFVGELGTSYKTIIANVVKEKVFLLDDGTATIEYYNKFIKRNIYNKYNFRELRFLFSGLKFKVKDKVNLFTYFDLESVYGVDVIKNNLTYLKNRGLNDFVTDGDVVYFIGQPVEWFMSFDFYKNSISKLIKEFNKKIIYIPHRSESSEQISNIASMKSEMLEMLKPNMPLELYFLKNNIYPSHVVSYISTALITLKILFENTRVDFIRIPRSAENEETIIKTEDIYVLFNKMEINELSI